MFALQRSRIALALAVVAGALLSARLATAAEPEVDPQAQEALDAFGKFYAGQDAFKVQVKIELKVEQKGKTQTQEFVQKFAAERPNKLAYELDSQQGSARISSNGEELALYMSAFKKYAVEEAPPTFTAMFQNPIVLGSIGFGNAGGVMVAILSDDPAASMLGGTETVEYAGVQELDGVKCHVIKATQEQFDWELWIDAGEQPLVRQFVPDLKKAFARLAKSQDQPSPFADMKITNTVSYTDWNLDPKLDDASFAFKAPEGAEEVDSLMELVTGRANAEPAPHALLGQPAPPIELELLSDGHLNLASLKGEKVVILDFWATWCGPCVRAMPIIDKVAEKFKDRGVALYAVNIQEEAEAIESFLKENELAGVSVALDKDGETARAYQANAIPQTVIVGKDGKVQVVMVGLSPTLEESLTKDIEALLDGKDLAAEALAEYEQKMKEREEKKAKQAEKADSE